jgi:hypothetical protein
MLFVIYAFFAVKKQGGFETRPYETRLRVYDAFLMPDS